MRIVPRYPNDIVSDLGEFFPNWEEFFKVINESVPSTPLYDARGSARLVALSPQETLLLTSGGQEISVTHGKLVEIANSTIFHEKEK